MVIDSETNTLYLADCLPKKYLAFFIEFDSALKACNIEYNWLSGTKDVWARDYMPVQVEEGKFIQFTYLPEYLSNSKSGLKSISDSAMICEAIGISRVIKSGILIDGGNVIKSKRSAILTDRIFKENPEVEERNLIRDLESLLEVERVIIIPSDPHDFTGHADGMVRFLDERTVLINRYDKNEDKFQVSLRMALHNAGLDWEEIPYSPYNNKPNSSACGVYINYLQMPGVVFVPIFEIAEDEPSIKKFEKLFVGQKIVTVKSNELAQKGGLLNCISWNIKKG
jgi:agmatine deiminase